MESLKGKKSVLTGASGGLGNLLLERLHDAGAEVVLSAYDDEHFKKCEEIYGDTHHCVQADLCDTESVNALIKEVRGKWDKLDGLLNVAGIGVYKPIKDATDEDWQRSFDINVTAAFKLTRDLLPLLESTENSVVVNIGSGMGVLPGAERSLYCTSKFALRGLSLSLSEEYKGRDPEFVLMTLGSMLTEFGPLSIEEKEELKRGGKNYLDPNKVADEIIRIIESANRKAEYEIYPKGYEDEWSQ